MKSDINLLCLPCAGASATMYLRWRRSLPDWINLIPVELPGRGRRFEEPFVENFDQLVSQLCDEMLIDEGGHCAIFGHSMGALLAFGIAKRLQLNRMRSPLALFVSASPAPAHRNSDRYPDTHNDDALIADLRKQGGTPQEIFESPELLQMTLDTLRADYRVCASFNYCRNMTLSVPIQAFAGRNDDIGSEVIKAWKHETTNSFDLNWFNGGHFFFRDNEVQLLRILEQSLKKFSGRFGRTTATPA